MPHNRLKVKKNPVGCPPKYTNPDELQAKIDEYFTKGCTVDEVWVKGCETPLQVKRPTITGLVLYCGFCNRQSFYDLEKQEKFSYTIKRARDRIAQHYEELLQKGLGAGAIFALKNFGWRDVTELEHSGEIKGGNTIINIVKNYPIKDKIENRIEERIADTGNN